MSFSDFGLDARLAKSVAALGFVEPTPIQEATIPVALTGQDILGSAETGTGKTAAYLLPVIQKMLAENSAAHKMRVLVLVPTRELALQVADQALALVKHTDLRVAAIYGGVGMVTQEQALKRRTDIIIATPGRLQDHMNRGYVSFKDLQVLVLDEADRMLDVGFLPAIRRIVRDLPRDRQTMLFSATLVPSILSLASEVTRKPVRIAVETTAAPQAIEQTLFTVPEHQKSEALQKLLADKEMESVLVFTAYKTSRRPYRQTSQRRKHSRGRDSWQSLTRATCGSAGSISGAASHVCLWRRTSPHVALMSKASRMLLIMTCQCKRKITCIVSDARDVRTRVAVPIHWSHRSMKRK